METGQLESLPEIIKCYGFNASWPNITGAKFTGTIELGPFAKYLYTFNNLGNKKVTFRLELTGREFEYLRAFEIIKMTTKK
jgi:hypothetical protein